MGEADRERADAVERLYRSHPGIERIAPYRESLLNKAGDAAEGIGRVILSSLSSTTRGTLALIVDFFIMLYAMFFFLKDGGRYLKSILQLPAAARGGTGADAGPLRVGHARDAQRHAPDRHRAGHAQRRAFAVLGIPGAVLWGLLMIVLSMLPVVGGALVWVPAAIILAMQGAWIKAIVLAGFCSLFIGSIDNILRPRLVGHDTQMSDLVVLFSTLGGITAFGAIGFIVGPIIAALFVTIWEIFGTAYRDDLEVEPAPDSPS